LSVKLSNSIFERTLRRFSHSKSTINMNIVYAYGNFYKNISALQCFRISQIQFCFSEQYESCLKSRIRNEGSVLQLGTKYLELKEKLESKTTRWATLKEFIGLTSQAVILHSHHVWQIAAKTLEYTSFLQPMQ